jgi:hypothetical protein
MTESRERNDSQHELMRRSVVRLYGLVRLCRIQRLFWTLPRAFQATRIKVESAGGALRQGAQSESTEIFDRAEAAQCLSRSCRLRSRCMVSHAAYDADLPVF